MVACGSISVRRPARHLHTTAPALPSITAPTEKARPFSIYEEISIYCSVRRMSLLPFLLCESPTRRWLTQAGVECSSRPAISRLSRQLLPCRSLSQAQVFFPESCPLKSPGLIASLARRYMSVNLGNDALGALFRKPAFVAVLLEVLITVFSFAFIYATAWFPDPH